MFAIVIEFFVKLVNSLARFYQVYKFKFVKFIIPGVEVFQAEERAGILIPKPINIEELKLCD